MIKPKEVKKVYPKDLQWRKQTPKIAKSICLLLELREQSQHGFRQLDLQLPHPLGSKFLKPEIKPPMKVLRWLWKLQPVPQDNQESPRGWGRREGVTSLVPHPYLTQYPTHTGNSAHTPQEIPKECHQEDRTFRSKETWSCSVRYLKEKGFTLRQQQIEKQVQKCFSSPAPCKSGKFL